LVVGILLACGAAIMTIMLLLLPLDNKARVALLVFMFLLLAFSMALILHYFDRLRLGVLLGTIFSAISTVGFGWYVWPDKSQAKAGLESPHPEISTPKLTEVQQQRSELRNESSRPLRDVGFRVKLDHQYSIQDIGHFRIMFEILDNQKDRPDFYLGCQDAYSVNQYFDPIAKQFGTRCTVYYRRGIKPDSFEAIPVFSPGSNSTTVLGRNPWTSEIEYKIDLYNQLPTYRTIEDFNRKYLYIFVTAPLVGKISEVSFTVNNWELLSAEPSILLFPWDKPIAPWFTALSSSEKAIEWRGAYLKERGEIARSLGLPEVPVTWNLDFALIHPKKIADPDYDPLKIKTQG